MWGWGNEREFENFNLSSYNGANLTMSPHTPDLINF